MRETGFSESLYELIAHTSTNLPGDVRWAIEQARQKEDAQARAGIALSTIARNIYLADQNVLPICQDTGMLTFEIKTPIGFNQISLKKEIHKAVAHATQKGKLRTNSVDSLTGANSGDNLGPGTPILHFEQTEIDHEIEIKLILKGGGCENKNIQYSLPAELEGLGKAERDLDGVRKCILHAVYQAQGQGCSAGFLGVSIGGDRTSGYAHAKEQLFRPLTDANPISELAELESYIMDKANTLGIGTMGFGGEATLLGCKIGVQNRLPASFFVSVAYNCWAFRRLGVVLDAKTGSIKRWLYRDLPPELQGNTKPNFAQVKAANELTGKEIKLCPPVNIKQIKALNVGDIVLIDGMLYTGRDAVHKYLVNHDCPVDLRGQFLYHCGPVVLKEADRWKIKAAGPTTSSREEPYQAEIISKFGLRAVIGKGGMGAKTLKALQEHGAVYLNAIGGAAQYYSECIEEVTGVDFLEFGIPEAMWHLKVKGFAAIVTMDAKGNSLHVDIDRSSLEKLSLLREPVFI
ncbi:MAG: FumA C-terminus/TtdB family hydratase beta subunit [Candidatus Caenarcaniphilales bacterium]|nr:FumA C-terminus/TtdB family hydratase beta subunit [Candidatus Caenarcaniphilales bacterium]